MEILLDPHLPIKEFVSACQTETLGLGSRLRKAELAASGAFLALHRATSVCCTDTDPQAEWSAGLGHTQGRLLGLGKTRHTAPQQPRLPERIKGLKPNPELMGRERRRSRGHARAKGSLPDTHPCVRGGQGCVGSQNPLRMEMTTEITESGH